MATWSVLLAGAAAAQEASDAALDRVFGVPVTAVRVTADGIEVRDPQVQSLIEMRAGEPLTPAAVRRTIVHLMALGVYLDVRVRAEAAHGGARVAVELIPLREVARLVFAGETGLPERVLRDAAVLRFGPKPPIGRATDLARTLEDVYRDHGYLRASVRPRPFDAAGLGRGDLVFDVAPGTRAVVRSVQFRGAPDEAVAQVRDGLALRPGAAYEPAALRRRLAVDVDAFRARGYLEARADPFVSVHAGGDAVDLTVAVNRGPLVSVSFAGDPIPAKDREALVPVAREASADEDLLEDAQFGIERHLRNQGYRDARAPFTRVESAGRLTIVYTVTKGPLYRVAAVAFEAVASAALPVQGSLAGLKPGDAFVQARLDADVAAVIADLRRRGYTRATVTPTVVFDTATRRIGEVAVRVALRVDEGPRAVVTSVGFDGALVK
ncbi:MAG: hypothetical protein FJ087_21825, partial [Deltaproteobacteria bacterium]|nr:hypothetical protein [Deltaproteobacteria bacterium]